ncbi:hypothetical protein GLYMA_13G327400v4 [Glycine max]|uniref:Uncharacterized protein n=2 Tax=Glycine subgen. Soja TaxID=1462606 RepID=K7M377_SOYBN|nr:hypothetical protein GYH30_038099 [Glycine max]KRH22916.1 hypothetical protein GLYMA_13G327400v4 [Glycine max]RZB84040.1 hypothetical protein D0Y65_032467 [Glycine soja]
MPKLYISPCSFNLRCKLQPNQQNRHTLHKYVPKCSKVNVKTQTIYAQKNNHKLDRDSNPHIVTPRARTRTIVIHSIFSTFFKLTEPAELASTGTTSSPLPLFPLPPADEPVSPDFGETPFVGEGSLAFESTKSSGTSTLST